MSRRISRLRENSANQTPFLFLQLACRGNAEYRAVDLCEEFASRKVLELAMKYAGRLGQMALVTKLQSVARAKGETEAEAEEEARATERSNGAAANHFEEDIQEVEDDDYILPTTPEPVKPVVEIKPISLSGKRLNPFRKSGKSPMLKGTEDEMGFKESEF